MTPRSFERTCCALESSPQIGIFNGDRDKIYDLANKGFNLYAGENSKVNGGFEHSGLFALIDKNGDIRCRKDDFGNPIFIMMD
jgi:cytochrome oxidase Cu insertion factor (SCO1/SenC/PrrC family)